MPSRLVLRGFFLTLIAAGLASAQNIDFTLTASESGQSIIITNGGNPPLGLSTAVGTSVTATVTATYFGNSVATISQPLQQTGSTEFKVTSTLTTPPPPETFTNGQSFTITITYTPTTAAQANGTITVFYTEPGTGTNATPVQSEIVIGLQGTAPSYGLGYVLESSQNFVSISNGGNVPFGPTQINTSATADLYIEDTGTGEGVITAITQPPAASPFKVTLIPQLPYGLVPGTTSASLMLLVTYTPTAVQTDTASIQITFQGGMTETVTFSGNGITSTFTYQVLVAGMPATTVASGGTITFPGANLGSSSSLILTVTNSGSASGTINSISTSGPFTLTTPITTPPSLGPGSKFSVPLTFTPTQIGTQTGYLVVGNTTFTLSGQGLGVIYSYTSSGVTTTVTPPNGVVLFSSIPVGQSEKVTFKITNSGTSPTTISLVGTSSTNNEFTVPTIPAQTLGPNQPLSFAITFTPTVTGLSTGTLMVNSTAIQLEGNATAPTTLPSYTITGPTGTVAPETQSNVTLTLSKAYPLDLTGTLTLTTQGVYGTDTSVQFENGLRTVDFTIPAGSTSANFAGEGTDILVQTGTVAETVILTPTFATTGGTDVTPSSPPILQFTIPSEAPVLQTAQVTNETDNGFDLVLTGYATTRSLSSLNVTFTPNSGYNIQTTTSVIALGQSATAYFASTSSESFGGQFEISVPFLLQGTVKSGQALIESIASVAATVSNGIGTSTSVSSIVQ